MTGSVMKYRNVLSRLGILLGSSFFFLPPFQYPYRLGFEFVILFIKVVVCTMLIHIGRLPFLALPSQITLSYFLPVNVSGTRTIITLLN
ncbi:hypothetical protein F4775DRAFT_574358 [Biscogniauxia sp. FL1348]|nr:hypothetical protein F4775DRAFT_574358 [Biscogniauxia sp. FL1348]